MSPINRIKNIRKRLRRRLTTHDFDEIKNDLDAIETVFVRLQTMTAELRCDNHAALAEMTRAALNGDTCG